MKSIIDFIFKSLHFLDNHFKFLFTNTSSTIDWDSVIMKKKSYSKNTKAIKGILPKSKHQSASVSKEWVIAGASVKGKSHVDANLPCQDNYFHKYLSLGWGVAIVCDGAGSAKNSEKGSKFVSEEYLSKHFVKLVEDEKWIEQKKLPNESEWEEKAVQQFKNALDDLKQYAEKEKLGLDSLACTAIVVIYSPIGLLVSHIGDGRAGYCNEEGEWEPIMIPHKGEESNQTIFLTSSAWSKSDNFQMSKVRVPECRVVASKPLAFVLMSDGCEQHSFKCSVIDPETKQWSDPNVPFKKFFDPLVTTLKDMKVSTSSVDINSKWENFLNSGTVGLKNEVDDKTMILGVIL